MGKKRSEYALMKEDSGGSYSIVTRGLSSASEVEKWVRDNAEAVQDTGTCYVIAIKKTFIPAVKTETKVVFQDVPVEK